MAGVEVEQEACVECEQEECCAICLQSVGTNGAPFALACGHEFCTVCLAHSVERSSACPLCAEVSPIETLKRCCIAASEADFIAGLENGVTADRARAWVEAAEQRAAVVTAAAAQPPPSVTEQQQQVATARRADRQFKAFARRNHLKQCPRCNAAIIKNGGCNHMTCRACGHRFYWVSAPLVHPCCGVHCTLRPPFTRLCTHVKKEDISLSSKAIVTASKVTCVALGAVPIALALTAAVPCALWMQHKKQRARVKQARARRQARQIPTVARAELQEQRLRAIACRGTGNHQWVADWCTSCGATRQPEGDTLPATANDTDAVDIDVQLNGIAVQLSDIALM